VALNTINHLPKPSKIVYSIHASKNTNTVVPPSYRAPPTNKLPGTYIITPDYRCTEIVKYYQIVPFKRGHTTLPIVHSTIAERVAL